MQSKTSEPSFARRFVFPALWLFAIPAVGWWFAQRPSARAFDAAQWIGTASRAGLVLGALSLLLVVLCAGFAFSSRRAQYVSFLSGWHLLRVSSVLQVLLQGFIAVMLSFWMTRIFFHIYIPKLILVIAVAAAVAAYQAIVAIFHDPEDRLDVEGEVLPRACAPALWARIDAICRKLGTQAPDQIVGGIDDNFFVTEHPVHLGERILCGRTLFVSLSLLKRLEKGEADAILAHEMAHFSGQDTAHSKRLTPLLLRYTHYLGALHAGVISRPIFHLMYLYWGALQLALARSSRARELRADRIAAETTSPVEAMRALLKVSAYSAYRARVEQGLFERTRIHSNLNIAQAMTVGFTEYAQGARLTTDLGAGAFPHPFDSHPALEERIANVGATLDREHVSELVTSPTAHSWFAEIDGAERVEQALWSAYEARFKTVHEHSLALRYLPSTPEERALVERFFPPCTLGTKAGETLVTLDCEQLRYLDWQAPVRWLDIVEIKADETAFVGKTLRLEIADPAGARKKLDLPLRRIANVDAALELIGNYYGRCMAAKAAAEEPSSRAS